MLFRRFPASESGMGRSHLNECLQKAEILVLYVMVCLYQHELILLY